MDGSYTGISYADARMQIDMGCSIASFDTLMHGTQYACQLAPGHDLYLWAIADPAGHVRIEEDAAQRLIYEGLIDPTKARNPSYAHETHD